MGRQKGIFFLLFFLDALTWSLDALLWPYLLHLVVDLFIRYEGDRAAAWEALQGPIWGGVCLVLYVEAASRTMGFLMARALPRLQADLRSALFDHVQRHSPHYFNERFAGSLANKISDLTASVEAILQQLFWPIIPAVSACLLGGLFFWFVNPLFAGLLWLWMALHLGVCFSFTRACDLREQRHGEARSTLLGRIVDSLTNNFTVNLFYRFDDENRMLAPFQKREEESNRCARQYVERVRCVISAVYFMGVVLGINGSLIYLWIHSQISTGEAVQVFTTSWNLAMILWTVGSALPALFQSIGTAKQAYSLMRDPQDLLDPPHAVPLEVSSGEIVFEGVSFQYGERKLFQNKSVRIRGGERVGLVGFTGSGKSTFVHLILRFFPLSAGKIFIDGQDIAQGTLESLRRQIALIPQDPLLFHRTLRENISYGRPEAAEEEIVWAARLAHCDAFILNMPHGYDAKVGERGTKLSGGEKQRIAIARAALSKAPILILDEATSALDSMTERYVQESLDSLMSNRTTLVIAHRLSTLSRMDRILVFDGGRIVEEGTPAALLSRDGLYAAMWRRQAGGFLPEQPV